MMRRRDFLARGAAIGLAAPVLSGCGSAEGDVASDDETTVPAPSGRFVEVAGERVHYWEQGAGLPVVLIHGASGNLRDWTFDVAPRLAARYRVIAFDRPGFGHSTRQGDGLSVPQGQARVLAAAAGALGARRPAVVGHSYGGAVAMAWGVAHDARGIVSVSGAVEPYVGPLGEISRDIGLNELITSLVQSYAKSRAGNGGIEKFVARVFRPQAVPAGYVEHIHPELSLREATMEANAADLNDLDDALDRLAPAYGRLRVPVEALHGTADRTVALYHARDLVAAAPKGRLAVLDGIGHMAHHFAGQKLDDAIARVAAV